MTILKYLLALLMMFGLSFSVLAQDASDMSEDEYENGCDNELDDDMDGDIDGDDSDCGVGGVLFSADDFDADSLRPYLVWGVGIALLSSVESSDTGTATN